VPPFIAFNLYLLRCGWSSAYASPLLSDLSVSSPGRSPLGWRSFIALVAAANRFTFSGLRAGCYHEKHEEVQEAIAKWREEQAGRKGVAQGSDEPENPARRGDTGIPPHAIRRAARITSHSQGSFCPGPHFGKPLESLIRRGFPKHEPGQKSLLRMGSYSCRSPNGGLATARLSGAPACWCSRCGIRTPGMRGRSGRR